MAVRSALLVLLLLIPAGAALAKPADRPCLVRTSAEAAPSGLTAGECDKPLISGPDLVARRQTDTVARVPRDGPAPCPAVKPEEIGVAPAPRGCHRSE